jgi:hypothetical protein
MTASVALTAPPWSHATCANRNAARAAKLAPTARTPKATAYSNGRTSMTVGTPRRASRRFVTNSDITNATPVEAAKNTPKKPASSSGSGYRAVAARENGRYSE